MDLEQLERTKRAFASYQENSVNRLSYQQNALSRASLEHKTALLKAGFGDYLESLLNCIEANQNVLNQVLEAAQLVPDPESKPSPTARLDHVRVADALLAVSREWSAEGGQERRETYGPVLDALPPYVRPGSVVLVPSSGLARLPFEIAARYPGARVLANESNVSLLLTANFVLNRCERTDNFRIYPHLNDLTNRLSSQDVTSPVAFPDVDVTERPEEFSLEMLPGDFAALCNSQLDRDSVDVVVTCFALNHARNILIFVQKIYDVLKPGGTWVNLGDLDCSYEPYHRDETTLLLPWDILEKVITQDLEFKMVKRETLSHQRHLSNGPSMRQNRVQSLFFICQKIPSES